MRQDECRTFRSSYSDSRVLNRITEAVQRCELLGTLMTSNIEPKVLPQTEGSPHQLSELLGKLVALCWQLQLSHQHALFIGWL